MDTHSEEPEWIEELILTDEESDNWNLKKISDVPQEVIVQALKKCQIVSACEIKRNFAPGTKDFREAVKELQRKDVSIPIVLLGDISNKWPLKIWLKKIFKFLTKF